MPEHEATVPVPPTTPEEEEEARRRKPDEVDELMDKMYKIISELGKTMENLATYISGAKEAQRGLIEAVGKMNGKIDTLASEVQKLSISLSQVFSEQAKGRYSEAKLGEGEASGVGEKVTVGDVREPGVDMLKGEVKKVAPPVAPVVASTVKEPKNEPAINDVIRDIISGKLSPGEVGAKVWEVLKR